MLIFWPYKMGSASCRALARSLEARRVYSNRRYRPQRHHKIINWGNGQWPDWAETSFIIAEGAGRMLNIPNSVRKASNKLLTLQTLSEAGVSIPKFTTDACVENLNYPIVCRTLLTSRSGNGIIIANNESELVPAPLYTSYISGIEFRVHVVFGEVIDYVQKKKLRTENLNARNIQFNPHIRNHTNGWVFARSNVDLPISARAAATKAVQALGLDFGATDCIVDADGNAYILEINTAPGLEGTTLEKYTQAFGELL